MDTPICLPNIKISEDDLMCVIKRDGKTVIIDQTVRITELEAQVAALQEIAKWERASRLRDQVDYETDDEMMPEFCRDAIRQLSEEHPEVDWK